jgi:hypothetical protein
MHYVTCRSHWMQKYNFGVMLPGVLFVESILVPPENGKQCVDVSRCRRTRMHYVTCRFHQMQKQKFGVTFPDALSIESVPVPPELEK